MVSNTWLIDCLLVCAALETYSASMKKEMGWEGGNKMAERFGQSILGLNGTGVVKE